MNVARVGPVREWDKVDVKDPHSSSSHLIRLFRMWLLTLVGAGLSVPVQVACSGPLIGDKPKLI